MKFKTKIENITCCCTFNLQNGKGWQSSPDYRDKPLNLLSFSPVPYSLFSLYSDSFRALLEVFGVSMFTIQVIVLRTENRDIGRTSKGDFAPGYFGWTLYISMARNRGTFSVQ